MGHISSDMLIWEALSREEDQNIQEELADTEVMTEEILKQTDKLYTTGNKSQGLNSPHLNVLKKLKSEIAELL